MLPLILGPLANSTISEWKIPNISFRWCKIALGHCRKTEALKHFKSLSESWASFLKLTEQCNIFFFFFNLFYFWQARFSKENQLKGLKWTCLPSAHSSAWANFCTDKQLRNVSVGKQDLSTPRLFLCTDAVFQMNPVISKQFGISHICNSAPLPSKQAFQLRKIYIPLTFSTSLLLKCLQWKFLQKEAKIHKLTATSPH